MRNKGEPDSFCFFCDGREEHSPQRYPLPRSSLTSDKNSKMSLKRAPSRLSVAEKHLATEPSVLSFTKRSTLPLNFQSSRPSKAFLQPLTPKPTIRFSWNADLEQTKKNMQISGQSTPRGMEGDDELQKTKLIQKKLTHFSGLNNLTKASLISVVSSSPRIPKIEESLIMMDYFNPPSHQLLKLEEQLKVKSQQ